MTNSFTQKHTHGIHFMTFKCEQHTRIRVIYNEIEKNRVIYEFCFKRYRFLLNFHNTVRVPSFAANSVDHKQSLWHRCTHRQGTEILQKIDRFHKPFACGNFTTAQGWSIYQAKKNLRIIKQIGWHYILASTETHQSHQSHQTVKLEF